MRRRLAGWGAPAAALAACLLWTRAGAETVALVGATVHTVSGPTLENATVVLRDDKIAAVGANLAAPEGARVVSCQGKHVYPGFIAPISALGLVEIGSVRGTVDYAETGDVNPNIRAQVAINPESDLIPVARVNGLTSALIVPRGGELNGTSALIHLDGWTFEDMTIKAPVGLHVQWPAMGINRSRYERRSEEEQKKQREAALATIHKAFDDARAYWKAHDAERQPGIPRHDRDVKWDAMGRALRGEIPVFFQASAINQIQAVLRFVDEQSLKNVVLVDGYDAWRVADELKRRDIAVITGPTLSLPRRSYEPYDQGMSLPARLSAAGVRFCISDGGDGGEASNARNLPYHAAMAAAYGLPHDEALKAITLYPAQILGVADRLGSLEPGKLADLLVADGDPLEITTHVEQVWIAGKSISMENRQTRLFHKYDQRPRGPHARKHDEASASGGSTGSGRH
ncbi:MAG: amidohydrolase [Candidatus Eisenbacteria bacterium]|uniref:Amidohydrolase n=1 Tax=Eiseniibacteriota bacterium TaxID=2212470 RepID=A0A538TW51_UNCEI|nr:MAG: amidohydrolase [Candidatus Eisenbacteria bacterium]